MFAQEARFNNLAVPHFFHFRLRGRHAVLKRFFVLALIGLCITCALPSSFLMANIKASVCRSCMRPTDPASRGDRHLQPLATLERSLWVMIATISRVLTCMHRSRVPGYLFHVVGSDLCAWLFDLVQVLYSSFAYSPSSLQGINLNKTATKMQHSLHRIVPIRISI